MDIFVEIVGLDIKKAIDLLLSLLLYVIRCDVVVVYKNAPNEMRT